MHPIYYVANFKGGVGKTLFTVALLDYLIDKDQDCILIETDTSNSDVYNCYRNELKTEAICLDKSQGWAELVNICDENPDSTIIINAAARSNEGVKDFGGTLGEMLDELNRVLVTFWLIDDKRTGLELLADYLEYIPQSLIHVVQNRIFGELKDFHVFNSSKIKETVLSKKGKILELPVLSSAVTCYIYNDEISIRKVLDPETRIGDGKTRIPLGNRGLMKSWRIKCHNILGEVIK